MKTKFLYGLIIILFLLVLIEGAVIVKNNNNVTQLNSYTVIYQKTIESKIVDWSELFPTFNSSTLIGKNSVDVEQALGKPYMIVKDTSQSSARELWVYRPNPQEDPTGIFLFINNDILSEVIIDEFNGLDNAHVNRFMNTNNN